VRIQLAADANQQTDLFSVCIPLSLTGNLHVAYWTRLALRVLYRDGWGHYSVV